jgi:putative endonuclease
MALSALIRNRHVLIRDVAAPSVAPVMSDDPRHSLGRRGEQLAAEHLERLGYRVVARNYRTRFGELDLVVTDDDVLVFCEVKTRRAGSPWDNLGEAKRRQVRSMSRAWLSEATERPRVLELRFDAIGVVIDRDGALVRLDHLEGAF